MRTLVVSGTGTGVGKTVVTAALAARARERGESVAVVKAAQTGVGPGEPGDLDEVRRLSGVGDLHELARFAEPLAPATAARRAGSDGVSPAEVAARVRDLEDRDLVLVEGAGGLLVRLDAEGGTLADVAAELGAPVLARRARRARHAQRDGARGEALRARGLDVRGRGDRRLAGRARTWRRAATSRTCRPTPASRSPGGCPDGAGASRAPGVPGDGDGGDLGAGGTDMTEILEAPASRCSSAARDSGGPGAGGAASSTTTRSRPRWSSPTRSACAGAARTSRSRAS